MKKIIVLLIILVGAYFVVFNQEPEVPTAETPLNATYLFEEEPVTLTNGLFEENIENSVAKNTIAVFGEPAYGDIDKDGDDDAVLLFVNESGGTGVFYYVGLAINQDGNYKGTDTILLGDRIAPQNFKIEDNRAKINYAVRKNDDPFSAQPSVGKSLHLQYDEETLRLIYVEPNFEGEHDPSRITPDMKVPGQNR